MADRRITVTVAAKDSFSGVMDQYNTKMRQAAQSTQQTSQAASMLGSVIAGAFSVAAIARVVDLANEYANLGAQVTANQTLFTALTQGMGDQTAILASLQNATGGVVDNMTLMAGASQLLRLNIVDNSRDLEHLVGNIQRLKQPTEDMTDAVQNFALMLSNESLLRLDSFGISSANVKRAMDELNLSFREAVMTEMDKQVERLGDAANIAETNWAKLQTRIENVQQAISVGFSQGREGAAAIANDVIDTGEVLYDFGENLRTTLARMYGATLGQQLFPAAGAGIGYTQEQLETAVHAMANLTRQQQAYASMVDLGAASWQGITRQMNQAATAQQRFTDVLGLPSGFSATPAQYVGDSLSQLESGLMRLQNLRVGSAGGSMLFTERDVRDAEDLVRWVDALKGKMDLLQEADILPEGAADRMKELAEGARDFAEQANKGYEAFKNLSLAEVFGTDTPDRMFGELDTKLIAAAQAAGMTADEIERLQSVLDRTAGRETEFSQGVDDFLNQMVKSGMTAQQLAESRAEFAEILRRASQMGLDMSKIEQVGNLGYLFGMTGSGSGQQIDVQPGDNFYSLRDRYGGQLDDYRQLLNQNGILLPGSYTMGGIGQFNPGFNPDEALRVFSEMQGFSTDIQTASADTGENFDDIVQSTDTLNTNLTDVSGLLDNMFAKKYVLKLDAVAPDWLKTLLSGAGGIDFAAAMAQATTANGGTPPGQQPAAGSGRVSLR